MTRSSLLDRLVQHEGLNFFLTNRIPRRLATAFVGWFSRIEQPLVRDASIGVWQMFAGPLDLEDAKRSTFKSLHDCFVRELKPGARSIDPQPHVIVSPCDGIVGASGRLRGVEALQAKGRAYELDELLCDQTLAGMYRDGCYVTLRLTSTMYHRFHAPFDCSVDEVTYVSGDVWNVNPPALQRVDRLYCRNERAIVPLGLTGSRESIALIPVGAILVASIRFAFVDVPRHLRRRGSSRIACRAFFAKGDEMGYFCHGSTIIVLGTTGLEPCANVRPGAIIRMGEPLLRHGPR